MVRCLACAAALLAAGACSDAENVVPADSAAAAAAAAAASPVADVGPTPGAKAVAPSPATPAVAVATEADGAKVSKEQFKTLRWIQGSWIGREGSGIPFYERYEVANDTAFTQYSYADAKFSSISETSSIVLTNGHVFSGPATASWIATKWEASVIAFSPFKGATSAFRWERLGADTWRATLLWRENGADKQRVYDMKRTAK